MKTKQRGFMVMSAVVLAVVVGLMAATVAYLYSAGARSAANQAMTTQAFYIAEAGLEVGLHSVSSRTLSLRSSCAGAAAGPITFQGGTYTITGTAYTPTQTTLTAGITAASTIIPVASVAGYAPSGSIIIDDEIIDYGSVGTSGSACSPAASPCFLGAVRGQGGLPAASHSSGTRLRQDNFCQITSVGTISSGLTTLASRTVRKSVKFAQPMFGGNQSGGEVIAMWNGRQWVRQATSGSIQNRDVNGMTVPTLSTGWGVGQRFSGGVCGGSKRGFFILFNATSPVWTQASCAQNNNVSQNLYGVDCIDGTNICKAVGNSRTFASWDGSDWSTDSVDTFGSGSVPSIRINAVSCISSSNCYAVADDSGGEVIIYWNGSIWRRVGPSGSLANEDLTGIDCVNGSFCMVVGDDGAFFRYNGSGWSTAPTSGIGSNHDMNGVYCNSTTDCWAVGNNTGGGALFDRWNGSVWSRPAGIYSGAPDVDMRAVFCADVNNCWAVGEFGMAFWNGLTWEDATTGVAGLEGYGVSGRKGVIDRSFGWREVFN